MHQVRGEFHDMWHHVNGFRKGGKGGWVGASPKWHDLMCCDLYIVSQSKIENFRIRLKVEGYFEGEKKQSPKIGDLDLSKIFGEWFVLSTVGFITGSWKQFHGEVMTNLLVTSDSLQKWCPSICPTHVYWRTLFVVRKRYLEITFIFITCNMLIT